MGGWSHGEGRRRLKEASFLSSYKREAAASRQEAPLLVTSLLSSEVENPADNIVSQVSAAADVWP